MRYLEDPRRVGRRLQGIDARSGNDGGKDPAQLYLGPRAHGGRIELTTAKAPRVTPGFQYDDVKKGERHPGTAVVVRRGLKKL